ncbi:MAG: DUF460 domain-containing protein [Archaeoglobus sp.]|nr:DUF460 domain-containing protein [Archaeoglobus sp.]
MTVFGIDIIKGSLSGKERPRYSLILLTEDGEEEYKVTRNRLFRMIREKKPEIVAIDNISELFKSKKELVNFLKEIPATTKLVQISGRESLPALAKRYGIKLNIRSPADEARACAYLASFGVGDEISVFFDKTLITVSRNRSLGKGGWHQNRYRRKIHDQVRMVFSEIKQIIRNHGLEFSEDVRQGYGGISRGRLLVNAERSKVPINSFKTKNVQVKVEAVEKDRIEYIPLSKRMRYLIVGVDPGSTVGVAVLSLDGNILGIKSKKGWSFSEVIEYIRSFGTPVLVATDRASPPDYVNKIKASFNAVLYTPKENMTVERKSILVKSSIKGFDKGHKILNDHERDALSAAFEAYNSYKSKLKNIEKRIPAGFDLDLAKAKVIKGMSVKAILEGEKEVEVKETKKPTEQVDREELLKKEKIIRELMEENEMLKESINQLKEEIDKLRGKIVSISTQEHERVRKDNYVRNLEAEIARLRKELKQRDEKITALEEKLELVKRMRYLEIFEGWKWVKMLKKFTKEEIERLESDFGINEGDIIFIKDCSGGGRLAAEHLCKRGIKAVISGGAMSHLAASIFEESDIPVFGLDEVELEFGDEMVLLNARKFEHTYRKRISEMEKRKLEKVEKLFEDYKTRRKQTLG